MGETKMRLENSTSRRRSGSNKWAISKGDIVKGEENLGWRSSFLIEFTSKKVHSRIMPDPRSKPNAPQKEEDAWGTTTREAYEDRPVYQRRKTTAKRKGSPLLRAIGGLAIVGGIAWGTYVVTSTEGVGGLLRPGWPARPILVCAAGLLVLLLEKLFR